MIKWSKTLPDPDHFKHSVIISVIIHGSSLALLNLLTYGLWVAIALCGNVAHQFLFKLTQWPISAGMVLPALQKFPITIGLLLVSMAHASCGGLALICAVLMYFILLSKMYEDYLEEFVYKTAAVIAEKLFGRKSESKNAQSSTDMATQAIAQSEKSAANSECADGKSNEANADDDKKDNDKNEMKASKDTKAKKGNKKENKKKVEFADKNENDKSVDVDETTPLIELDSNEKSDLEVQDGAIVPSGSQESFEVLYNQLDPNDVALFSRKDEPEDMTEEEKLQMEKTEAGSYRIIW